MSAHCPRTQLKSSKGLQKYHFYSDSPSQNITVLTEKSGKGLAGHGANFPMGGCDFGLVGASEEELSEHHPKDKDN